MWWLHVKIAINRNIIWIKFKTLLKFIIFEVKFKWYNNNNNLNLKYSKNSQSIPTKQNWKKWDEKFKYNIYWDFGSINKYCIYKNFPSSGDGIKK